MRGLRLKKGAWVIHQGEQVRVVGLPSLSTVTVTGLEGGLRDVPVQDLLPPDAVTKPVRKQPLDSPEYQTKLRHAEEKLDLIRPLILLGDQRTLHDVQAVADQAGVSCATIYRWLKRYEQGESVDALLRQPRNDWQVSRVSAEVESLIDSALTRFYLTPERPSIQSVYDRLRAEIDLINRRAPQDSVPLKVPAYATFRRRIEKIERRKRLSRRFGPKVAQALDPIQGQYPGATYPLAVVQVDHTPLDIILVDSIRRQPMGRAWLTLVMDVYSRMVLGFSISFDAPSAFGTGIALSHAILPKETWLALKKKQLEPYVEHLKAQGDTELELTWPCWGRPTKVFMDNAREFRGKVLEHALNRHNIMREFRMVGRPHYGGHVERLLGTFAQDIHTLPGTTFSNVAQRGEYDSEKHAALTVDAFELWLTAYILSVYHRRVHDGIGSTPLAAWERGLMDGTEDHPPVGIPERYSGEAAQRLRLDLMPYFERSVQREGIAFNGLRYVGDVLGSRVGEREARNQSKSRLFRVAYDPRDISGAWFLDPEADRYFPIRVRQADFPTMSIWELERARRYAKEKKLQMNDERAILQAYRLMMSVVEGEKTATRTVRREQERQRRRERLDASLPQTTPTPKSPRVSVSSPAFGLSLLPDDEVTPFEEPDD